MQTRIDHNVRCATLLAIEINNVLKEHALSYCLHETKGINDFFEILEITINQYHYCDHATYALLETLNLHIFLDKYQFTDVLQYFKQIKSEIISNIELFLKYKAEVRRLEQQDQIDSLIQLGNNLINKPISFINIFHVNSLLYEINHQLAECLPKKEEDHTWGYLYLTRVFSVFSGASRSENKDYSKSSSYSSSSSS